MFCFSLFWFYFQGNDNDIFPSLASRPLLLPFVVERMDEFDAMRCGVKAYHATKQPNERCFVCEMLCFFYRQVGENVALTASLNMR